MEEKQGNKNNETGCTIALLIVFLIIFIPIIIGTITDNIEISNKAKHETKLIEEGKTKAASEVINEVIEIFKNKEKDKLEEHLTEDFKYYDNNHIEYEYLDSFWRDLTIYSSSCEIERRENSIKGEETYRIYWNVVEENKNKGIDKNNPYYCLQRVTIVLKRIVKEDIITYDIEKIILADN